MKKRKRRTKKKLLSRNKKIVSRLEKAIHRNINFRGNVFDVPEVKSLMKKYDKLLK